MSQLQASNRSVRTEGVQSAWQVFRFPTVLGLLTAIGLISALMGDDGWDVLSWIVMFAPIATVVWAWRRHG
ncbi:MAG: hypothetical protein QM749_01000 [Aquabacterium sp.]